MSHLGHPGTRGVLTNYEGPAEVHQDGWDWTMSSTEGLRFIQHGEQKAESISLLPLVPLEVNVTGMTEVDSSQRMKTKRMKQKDET